MAVAFDGIKFSEGMLSTDAEERQILLYNFIIKIHGTVPSGGQWTHITTSSFHHRNEAGKYNYKYSAYPIYPVGLSVSVLQT